MNKKINHRILEGESDSLRVRANNGNETVTLSIRWEVLAEGGVYRNNEIDFETRLQFLNSNLEAILNGVKNGFYKEINDEFDIDSLG